MADSELLPFSLCYCITELLMLIQILYYKTEPFLVKNRWKLLK